MPTDILFIQTADPLRYKPILDATSRTAIEFCRRHGHAYESYVGIRRGVFPWQATFNRIPMLDDIVRRGFGGWVIYLDADAYVFDLDFDLAGYLADKRDRAAVMVNMGAEPQWAVNAGVLFLNLGHPLGREIVAGWSERFAALSDDDLAGMAEWRDECSDQSMLFEVLDTNVPAREAVHYESNTLINHEQSRFIRQILRAYYPDLDARAAAIRIATAQVLGGAERDSASDLHPVIVQALYRVLLGRDPDAGGLATYTSFMRDAGVETGLRHTLDGMFASQEYRARRALLET